MKQFEHCVVARLSAGRQRLVKALASKTSIFGELCHAAGASHITEAVTAAAGSPVVVQRADTVGFFVCSAVSFAIFGIFWGILQIGR